MTSAPRSVVAASIALRGTICASFAYAAADPSLPQLQGAATHARMLAWPFGALAVPVCLRIATGPRRYPWRVDALLALPFALDAAGNVLSLYTRRASYDTVNHAVSWLGLSLLVSTIPALARLPAWARAWIVLATGALAAVAWELGEYAAFIRTSHYSSAAYADTLTDLLAGTSGAACAAALVLLAAHRPLAHAAVPAEFAA
jgi:hypothetical protein